MTDQIKGVLAALVIAFITGGVSSFSTVQILSVKLDYHKEILDRHEAKIDELQRGDRG